jgi:ferredoxin
MPSYQARVDPELCVGARMCVGIDPDVFVYDPEATVTRVEGGPTEDDAVLDAADVCPVGAITVTDVEAGEQVAP